MRVEFWGQSKVFPSPPNTTFPNSGEQPFAASYSSFIFTLLYNFILKKIAKEHELKNKCVIQSIITRTVVKRT